MKYIVVLICIILSAFGGQAGQQPAVYSGSIKGYTATAGFKTGKVFVNNVTTGRQEMYLIDISPSGKFSVEIPLKYNNEVWISFPFFQGTVYLEPGKELVHDFDISIPAKVSSVFRNDGGVVNNDFNKVRAITQYNWNKVYADIYGLTPEEYKAYFLAIQAEKLAAVENLSKTERLSKKAVQLATADIKYDIAIELMNFNSKRESAYRIKNKVGFKNRVPVISEVRLDTGYFDFLKTFKYNDSFGMQSFKYYIFINRLKFLDLIYNMAEPIDYTEQINHLKQLDTTDASIMAIITDLRKSMKNKAREVGALEGARPIVLKSLLKTDITLELELMELQDLCQGIYQEKIPLSNATLDSLKRRFRYTSFFMSLIDLNNKVRKEIETSEHQDGYAANKMPAISTDSIFDNIISKYKGKTIFIDFWATWCGPCLQGIQEIEPIKTALVDKNVVFMYITNDTSPETAYRTLIPKIKGEHYRVTADEYNLLSIRFKIYGIPHYAIVNPEGIVVNKDFHWVNTEDVKKALLTN